MMIPFQANESPKGRLRTGRQLFDTDREEDVIIESLAVGPIQANCFVVGCDSTKEAVVIDPGEEPDRILDTAAARGLTIKAILNTHGHFDHVGGNRGVKDATGAPLMIHRLDAPMLEQLSATARMFGLRAENSPPPDRLLEDDDTVSFGDINLRVIHTPGHTPGGVSFYTTGHVFVGDTLFAGSIGRTDLPGGDFDTLIASIQNRLFSLPDDVHVHPGHMGPTQISLEKRTNPFAALR